MPWNQVYDPLNQWLLSTLLAATPIFVLLCSLAFGRIHAHWAALLSLGTALTVAVIVFGMPPMSALAATAFGAATGLFPIGWIVLNIIFLYQLTQEAGLFAILQASLTTVTQDRRLQLLLIAFCFGAFFEGAAGFGTPVAVTAAILIGLGFSPLKASGLSLIANTAPVAFGACGIPILTLQKVTELDLMALSAMVGRQLPFFSLLVPFWLVWAFAGFKGMRQVWPAALVAGLSFAGPQFLLSNLHGPTLVDIVAALCSMLTLTWFLLKWQPKDIWNFDGKDEENAARAPLQCPRSQILKAWLPWIILSIVVFIWGLPSFKAWLNALSNPAVAVPHLHHFIVRVAPVVAQPQRESAIYSFSWLSFTGTGILIAAVISGLLMGYRPLQMIKIYGKTIIRIRYSLATIAAMLALGFVTRYSGLDATMGLTFAKTGFLYPFFGTLLGWLGVALTGSDTSSNVLFGSLQRITAEQIGISPILMAAANSSGGVMGKMIDAQSIVVASTATKWYGHEGDILRFVFFHSLVLAALMGIFVLLQAYVAPFTYLVIH